MPTGVGRGEPQLGENVAHVLVHGWLTAYVIDCTLTGALLCWLRLRTHTIWPAVLGHAVLSGFPVPVMAVWMADTSRHHDEFAVESLGGWVGWILKAALLLLLVVTGRFRPAPPHTGTV